MTTLMGRCGRQSIARERTVLHSGISRRNDPRTARVERVGADRLSLRTENFDHAGAPQIYFTLALGETRYFFAAAPVGEPRSGRLDVELPRAIYRAERRDLFRIPPGAQEAAGERVTLSGDAGEPVPLRLVCAVCHAGIKSRVDRRVSPSVSGRAGGFTRALWSRFDNPRP